MKLKLTLTAFILGAFCSLLPCHAQEEEAADKDDLESLLKSTGWDVLIGTWLNPKGEEFIFSWQYPGTTLKMEAEVGGVKRTSIYVKRPNSKVANAFAYDSAGGSNFGSCVFSKGIAKFEMSYHLPDSGELQTMKFQYTLTSKDGFEAKMESSEHIYKYTRK